MRLVEKTEAHVVIGLLLLLLLGLLSGRSVSSTAGGSASSRGGTTSATGWDGGEFGGTLGDQLCRVSYCSRKCRGAQTAR